MELLKKIKDIIDKIIKRIKEFFVKKKDPKELVEVPQNAIKETKSFLDKAKKVLNNIGAKIKKHPKATAAALVSLTLFSVATVWKKRNEKDILTTCERQKIYDLVDESNKIIYEANREIARLSIKSIGEKSDMVDNQKRIYKDKRDKAFKDIESDSNKLKKSSVATIQASYAKVYQVISLIGTLVSALIIAGK